MANEAYCNILAYSVCCVILAQIELGIEVVFWKDEEEEVPGDGPAIPPMVRPG